MRVAATDVARTLRNPAACQVVLLYGDDLGLVRERGGQLAAAVLGGQNDPFRLSVLGRDEHARLAEEWAALSLTGGRRVIRVLEAGDALTPTLSRLPEAASNALIVLEAGALTARSKLRTLVEKQQAWAAIACYPATPAMIVAELNTLAAAAGCTLSRSAADRLASMLPDDTAARQSEVEKLLLYVGAEGVIDEAAVDACVAGGRELSMGELLDAAFVGEAGEVATAFQRLVDDGGTGPGIIASLNNHVQRVLKLRLLLDDGIGFQTACTMLSPPAYPRQATSLMRQVRGWSVERLMRLQEAIKVADLACKQAGSRDVAIVGRLLLAMVGHAARSGSR